jgi:hypothetical protein
MSFSKDASRQKQLAVGTILLLSFALFFPTFHRTLGSRGAILVNGGLLIGGLLIVGHLSHLRSRASNRLLATLAALAFVMTYYSFAITLSSLFMSSHLIVRDLFELHKPLLYFIVLLIPFFLTYDKTNLRLITRSLVLLFVCIVALGLIQHFRLWDGLSTQFTKLHNIQTRRVSSPFVNPYDYALCMSLFLCVSLMRFAAGRSYANLTITIAAGVMMMLTQSRAVTIATAIVLAFGLLFLVAKAVGNDPGLAYRRMALRLSGFYAVAAGSVWLVYEVIAQRYSYLVKGIRAVSRGQADRSLQMRFSQWDSVIDLAVENPLRLLLGNGVSKSAGLGVESIYSFFLYRYGLIALMIVFFVPIFGGVMASLRSFSLNPSKNVAAFGIFCWFGIILIASLSNNFTEQIRLSFLYYLVLGGIICFDLQATPKDYQ